jgi:hypothetical protein
MFLALLPFVLLRLSAPKPDKTLLKGYEPPCPYSPQMNFMKPNDEPASSQNLAVAAWFARILQFEDSFRSRKWRNLPETPLPGWVHTFFLINFMLSWKDVHAEL